MESVPVKTLEELTDTSLANPGVSNKTYQPKGSLDSTPKDILPKKVEIISNSESGMASEKGLILAADGGKPIPLASIILIGISDRFSCQSDKDGLYDLSGVKAGYYRIKVGKKGFSVFEREGLAYHGGMNPFREIRLERSVLKGLMIEAKGGSGAGTSATLLSTRRTSSGVMEGVSAEQIAKSTDADAGAVAKRVTGTSLVGGRYVYVRGLGERYTNMTLNGLPVPSPEKDKRVVPQDLFPSWALESFAIRKTFSPEMYSDFAGGSVGLETKGIPDKPFLKIAFGASATDFSNDGQFLNLGESRYTYDGGQTYFGFDDGTRNLPKSFPTSILRIDTGLIAQYRADGFGAYTKKERLAFALKLTDKYAIDTVPILPNQNYSFSLGNVRPLGNDGRYGFLISAGFKNKYIQKEIRKNVLGTVAATYDSLYKHPIIGPITYHVAVTDTLPGYTGDPLDRTHLLVLQKLNVGQKATIGQGIYEAVLSGLADVGYEDHNNKIFWKNFFVNIGTDEATAGHWNQYAGGRQDNPVENRYLLEFNQRSLIASQVGGGHYLGVGPLDSTSWAVAYNRTQGNTPDSRRYLYFGQTDSTSNSSYWNNDIWGTRIFEKLEENSFSGRGDAYLVLPPEIFKKDTVLTDLYWFSHLRLPQAQAGIFTNIRSRDFAAVRYEYGASQNIEKNQTIDEIRSAGRLRQVFSVPSDPHDFRTAPKSYDEYNASERISGSYLSGSFGFALLSLPLTFDAGCRYENYKLRLTAPFTGQQYGISRQVVKDSTKHVDRDKNSFLPMLGLTIEPTRNSKLRFIYTQTRIHSEFREIAPYSYADYVQDRFVSGNPDLKETEVVNLDLRYDWYLPNRQIISFSLFRKDFTNPVEPVADNNHTQKFQNAHTAYVRGAEMEIILDLESMGRKLGMNGTWLKGWTVGGNAAIMNSHVELDTGFDAEGISKTLDVTSLSRPMVGQSPYLLNAQIGEEGDAEHFSWSHTLAFNVSGPRIRAVGIEGVPDEYEQPVPSLDYLGRVQFYKHHQLTLKIKNLLDSPKRFTSKEYNDGLTYNAVSKATLKRLYSDAPREYVIERTQEGIGYELGYAFEF